MRVEGRRPTPFLRPKNIVAAADALFKEVMSLYKELSHLSDGPLLWQWNANKDIAHAAASPKTANEPTTTKMKELRS